MPDFDLINQVDGIQSFPEFKGVVYSDGTIIWTINGGLKAFCAFSGLASIPFDTLGCQLFFLPTTRTFSKLIQYRLKNPDIAIGSFDVTYNEWRLVPELMTQGLTFDDTTIYYDVFFRRSKKFYISNIVVRYDLRSYLDPTVGSMLSLWDYLFSISLSSHLCTQFLHCVFIYHRFNTHMIPPVAHSSLDLPKLFHLFPRYTSWRTNGIWNGTRLGYCCSTNYYG